LLCLGISALYLLIQDEWTGPKLDESAIPLLELIQHEEAVAALKLGVDDESQVRLPQLLLLSTTILQECGHLFPSSMVSLASVRFGLHLINTCTEQ